MSYIQPILPLREPCHRMLARAAALKCDAAEVAHRIQCLPHWQRNELAALVAEHQALILRSHACTLMAHGQHVLGREYARSARRVEVGV